MPQIAVTDLMAARRHIHNVLLYLAVDGEHLTIKRFIELLDYFAENPSEYLELTQDDEH